MTDHTSGGPTSFQSTFLTQHSDHHDTPGCRMRDCADGWPREVVQVQTGNVVCLPNTKATCRSLKLSCGLFALCLGGAQCPSTVVMAVIVVVVVVVVVVRVIVVDVVIIEVMAVRVVVMMVVVMDVMVVEVVVVMVLEMDVMVVEVMVLMVVVVAMARVVVAVILGKKWSPGLRAGHVIFALVKTRSCWMLTLGPCSLPQVHPLGAIRHSHQLLPVHHLL